MKEILKGGRRMLTPEFQALAAHYAFEPVFANPNAGNGKGGSSRRGGCAIRPRPAPGAHLAVALARQGWRTAIVDCDVYSFSVPMLIGLEEPPQVKDRRMCHRAPMGCR